MTYFAKKPITVPFDSEYDFQARESGERTGRMMATRSSSNPSDAPLRGLSEVDSITSILSGIYIKPIPEVCPC